VSETLTIDEGGQAVTRQPRRDRSDDLVSDASTSVAVADAGHADHDPERMLADSRKALEQRDQELADARKRENDARTQAARARDEVARANMGRATDRVAAVGSALEAAKADQTAAKLAKRAARESGDIDAEIAADELLASANYRLNQASGELNWLKQQGGQPQPQGDQGATGGGQSAEARAWLDAHPRYHTDAAYRATANGAHSEALRAGKREGSQEYVDFIDQIVAQVYGENHGTGTEPPAARRQQVDNGRQNSTSSAGPTNRGGGGSASGAKTVQTLLGPVGVTRANGKVVQVVLPPAGSQARADWEEAASVNQMRLGDYAYEQVLIAEERAAGGSGGWVQGDGTVQR
jgi:hypothetical protein